MPITISVLRMRHIAAAFLCACALGVAAGRVSRVSADEVALAGHDSGCNTTYPRRCGDGPNPAKCCPANSVCCRARGAGWHCARSAADCQSLR